MNQRGAKFYAIHGAFLRSDAGEHVAPRGVMLRFWDVGVSFHKDSMQRSRRACLIGHLSVHKAFPCFFGRFLANFDPFKPYRK